MSRSRKRAERLGPFVDGYRARLLELGYSPGSVPRSLAALGHLDRWMDRHDTPVGELNGDVSARSLSITSISTGTCHRLA